MDPDGQCDVQTTSVGEVVRFDSDAIGGGLVVCTTSGEISNVVFLGYFLKIGCKWYAFILNTDIPGITFLGRDVPCDAQATTVGELERLGSGDVI